MNFSTEKMAKALDLPNRLYFTELKRMKPVLFANLQNEYNQGFQEFFKMIVAKVKKLLQAGLDIPKFIQEVQKEFAYRKEVEKVLEAKRGEKKIETIISSDSETHSPILTARADQDYIWSDDETPAFNVTELYIWKQKYEALQNDFQNLNQRYSSCKNALTNQIALNKTLEKENRDLTMKCVCGKIEQIFKRTRAE